MYIVFNL